MDSIPLTHARAFRVLWGFLWRSSLTTLPLWLVTPALTWWMVPAEALTDPLALLQPTTWVGFGSRFVLGSALLLLLSFYLMHVAMRWTLTADYDDFRLQAVAKQSGQRDT
jgi:hypothetical protein